MPFGIGDRGRLFWATGRRGPVQRTRRTATLALVPSGLAEVVLALAELWAKLAELGPEQS